MKFNKRTSIANDVLHNRFVLYFIFSLSILSLFYSVFKEDMLSAGVFILTSLLTSFFSKNMVVILVVALVVSNVVRLTNKTRDGFASGMDEEEEVEKDGFENAEEDEEEEGEEAFQNEETEEGEEDEEVAE